ncbi:unnamed protein product [Sphagnum tenellum]
MANMLSAEQCDLFDMDPGSAGRSPPTSTGAWGTAAPGSSPPATNSAWGSKQRSSATSSNNTGGAARAWGGGGSLPRPASDGSGTRPSSTGNIRQGEQQPDTPTTNSSSNLPGGPRPTSRPGVQVQTQVQSQASFSRPRSADTLRGGPSLSGFGDSSAAALAPAPAWSGHAIAGRLGQADEPHQASRFKLTRLELETEIQLQIGMGYHRVQCQFSTCSCPLRANVWKLEEELCCTQWNTSE